MNSCCPTTSTFVDFLMWFGACKWRFHLRCLVMIIDGNSCSFIRWRKEGVAYRNSAVCISDSSVETAWRLRIKSYLRFKKSPPPKKRKENYVYIITVSSVYVFSLITWAIVSISHRHISNEYIYIYIYIYVLVCIFMYMCVCERVWECPCLCVCGFL